MNSVKFKANINDLNKIATRVTSLENSVFPEPGEAPEGAILSINEEGLPVYVPADDVTVGHAKMADNLDSNVSTEDKVPYIFRTAGGSADIGEREFDTIVGGSVVMNQLNNHGDFDDATAYYAYGCTLSASNNIMTATSTSPTTPYFDKTTESVIAGHKILISFDINPESTLSAAVIQIGGIQPIPRWERLAAGWNTLTRVVSAVSTTTTMRVYFNYGENLNDEKVTLFRNAMIIDLTQMFGSTIADYIYTLETATAGAGVAWFKKLFPKDYYPYDAGTLKHVEGLSSHEMVGFNQWDEEWESGYIQSSTGIPLDSPAHIRSKNFIPVVPSTVYYNKGYTLNIFQYDADKNFISNANTVVGVFTTSANTHFLKFYRTATTYNKDICINLSWDGERDGEYEPYKKMSYPLDDSIILRGIPKLDANNTLYYDGDLYESDGKVTRKYKEVDLATLTWTPNAADTRLISNLITDMKPVPVSSVMPNMVAEKYQVIKWSDGLANNPDGLAVANSDEPRFYIVKTDALPSGKAVYELAEPTTEQAEPYAAEQWVDNFGTEEYVTTGIPVGHETRYPVNLKAKLEMLPNSPDGDGDYIMRQTNGMNAFIPYADVKELPDMPTENGTYVLQAVKSASGVTLSWVSAT